MAEVKVWQPQEIAEKLNSDAAWTERALVVLFERQTSQEQETEETIIHNKVGFSTFDAEFFTSLAKSILAGKHLNDKCLQYVRYSKSGKPRIAKYSKQLAAVAAAKAARSFKPNA